MHSRESYPLIYLTYLIQHIHSPCFSLKRGVKKDVEGKDEGEEKGDKDSFGSLQINHKTMSESQ